ncbi:MAG: hypothetical protein PHT54_01920 [Candidatus Nanoarchaeia archaeon]|nr:hypothetical protein [Candidatus Nanoarchaeia archaeon]
MKKNNSKYLLWILVVLAIIVVCALVLFFTNQPIISEETVDEGILGDATKELPKKAYQLDMEIGSKININKKRITLSGISSDNSVSVNVDSKIDKIRLGSSRTVNDVKIKNMYSNPEGNVTEAYAILGVQAASITCKDLDNGINYFTKESASGPLSSENPQKIMVRTDKCLNSIKLIEYWCNNNGYLKSETYSCPNGCRYGACIKDSRDIVTQTS